MANAGLRDLRRSAKICKDLPRPLLHAPKICAELPGSRSFDANFAEWGKAAGNTNLRM